MIDLDPETLTNQERYKLLIGTVVPRPIAWVSTVNRDGLANLAPFSFFNGVCSSPLIISFAPAIRGSDGQKKDTLKNIEATGEFVVNIVTEDLAVAMNQTAGEYPPDVSEFAMAGLTPLPSDIVRPPRVQESPIQLECVLHTVVTIGESVGSGSLVLGRVVRLHYAESVYDYGKVRLNELHPIGRLAGSSYCRVTDTFDLARPRIDVS